MAISNRSTACALIVGAAFCLGACQTTGSSALPASRTIDTLSPAASQAIADDLASKLTGTLPPGPTISLDNDKDTFAAVLQSSLKKVGYAVSGPDAPTDEATTVKLTYVVEDFEGQILARLSTATVDLGRVYAPTTEGVAPTSPISVMHRS